MRFTAVFLVTIAGLGLSARGLEAKDVSGPQVGEQVAGFTIRGVLDDERGKEIDLVKNAAGKPLLLAFVHERTRPSLALARQVLDQVSSKNQGLVSGMILLASDVAETEQWVMIAQHALPRGVTIGISPDGAQGPAAYNLNPRVQLTVIAAKDGRVVSNQAFTAPTPADAAKVSAEISAALAK